MTLGGSLYGRVYTLPALPKAPSSWDGGTLWEPGLASADHAFSGVHC